MDKGFTIVLNLLWPSLCAAKRNKSTIGKQFDAEKNVRAQARNSTESTLVDALPFRVEGLVDTLSFEVGGKSYVAAQAFPGPNSVPGLADNTLVTLLHVESSRITSHWLDQLVNNWLADDDVFVRPFLSTIIFFGAQMSEVVISEDAHVLLRNWKCQYSTASTHNFDSQPSPGPYFFRAGSLWQARRAYSDANNTLLTAILPDGKSKFRRLGLLGEGYQVLSVAVPSRMCRSKTPKLPLGGTRIVVKDMFDIKGLRTSIGNRDYLNLYPPCTETASAIQRLIDAGAEVLGKSKLSSFAAREEPTESVDYQAPFNPRGDGYQSPAGSSSGSAAAVASYDWLDFAIGSDTTGSGRRPAHWNGCFSLRPTKTALSLDGFVKTFKRFDVPCLFGRDISKFRDFACAWYDTDFLAKSTTQPISSASATSDLRIYGKPPKIIYLNDFMLKPGSEQQRLIDGFVKDLEYALGVKQSIISLSKEWEMSVLGDLTRQGLQQYMKNAPTHAFFYDLYHDFDRFREDFNARYRRAPYVSPMLRWRWQIAQNLTSADRADAIKRMETFQEWFLEEVMCIDKYTTFIVLPIEQIAPRYRDEPPPSPTMPEGIGSLDIAPTLGAPELVIPIGELAYDSRVSKREEFLPVGVSLLAPPGSDLGLVEVAQMCLEKAGRPTAVHTGSRLFNTAADEKAHIR